MSATSVNFPTKDSEYMGTCVPGYAGLRGVSELICWMLDDVANLRNCGDQYGFGEITTSLKLNAEVSENGEWRA